jgi:hypothetical protein
MIIEAQDFEMSDDQGRVSSWLWLRIFDSGMSIEELCINSTNSIILYEDEDAIS